MNTQESYLRRQLDQVLQEMKQLAAKSHRIQFRYTQLQEQKTALEEDLKSLTKSTVKKSDLKISGVRKLQLDQTKKP